MTADLERKMREAEDRWLQHWLRGPQRTRWDVLPPQIGDKAPDVELKDVEGKTVRLSSFWSRLNTLLIFLRHYGCSCGVERMRRLVEEYQNYIATGANTIAVGQGEPGEITKNFIELRHVPCPVLCDPELKAYRAYGLLEGVPSQIDPEIAFWKPNDMETGLKFLEARRKTDKRLVDNPWLLPGEFIVDKQGILRYVHRHQFCEDYPNTQYLLSALRNI